MLNLFISISSIIILVAGFVTIFALLSRSYLQQVLRDADELTNNFKIDNFEMRTPSRLYTCTKRLIDIVLSTISLLLFWPLFFIIAIMIKLDSPGPIFFRQERVGLYGKIFHAYKFRTMYLYEVLSQDNIFKSISDPRITRVGKFLRLTALDELPKLLNVLTGAMSIVGTSIATEFRYESISSDLSNAMFFSKPGLTSLWSVSQSRKAFTYEKRLFFDLYYLNNISFKLDFIILIRTVIMTLGTTAGY